MGMHPSRQHALKSWLPTDVDDGWRRFSSERLLSQESVWRADSGRRQARKELTRSPNVREALFDDYCQIALLESKYGLETKSHDEWEHLWTSNPVYKELGKNWPIGWVLENENKQILGSVGNIPLLCEFQGRKIITASAHSWVVDSAYRSYSILLLDYFFSQKNVDLFLNNTIGPEALKAHSVFNPLRVPVGAWDQSAFWITHHRGFAASWMTMKAAPLAGFLSYPLSVVLLLKDMLAGRVLNGDRNEAKVEPCANFDDRFDTFWEALKRRNPHLLLGLRTREVLEWHFKYAILKNRVWILTVTNASSLAAYSIFCRQDNPRFGLKRMRLVDFQALDGSPALLLPMLSWALKRCRQEGIHMLENVGFCPGQRDIFENLTPHQRRLPSWLYFYKARDQRLARSLANPKVWNPSWFDGDSSL